MNKENLYYDLEIVAGSCSVGPENIGEIYEMAEIRVADGQGGTRPGIYGARVVGLKSRTEFSPDGKGVGIDFRIIEQALILGKRTEEIPPSVIYAQKIVQETGLLVATEIMMPEIQMPYYEGRIPAKKGLFWTPAVNQLGWTVYQMAEYTRRNGWFLGIKNGKWLGESLEKATEPLCQTITSMERTWTGLSSYAQGMDGKLILIHRGVDIPERGDFRNVPVHEVARRAKKRTGASLYFDPSHGCGSRLKDRIMEITIEAMKLKDGNNFLYDGALIEAGTSRTDQGQHLSLNELESLLKELAGFRRLRSPQ